MQPKQSKLGRMVDTLALLALANIVALLGLVAYLAANGTLTVERIREAVAVLRGECKESSPVAAKDEKDKKDSKVPRKAPAQAAISADELDMMHREAERLKTEIDQRVALANSIMLKVETEREAFRQEQEAAEKQQEADRAKFQNEGFQKQLQILTALAPKTALGHLLALNDPEKAARFLAAMQPERAKKIIEAAKKGEDLARIRIIVQRMQDVAGIKELRAQAEEGP